MASLESIYPLTAGRDESGRLSVAGLSIPDLAQKYRTPLYLFDAATV